MRQYVVLIGLMITGVGAHAQSFRDLPADTQARILDDLRPVIQQACAMTADTYFDTQFAELKAVDPCLAEQAKDRELVTYVREETSQRCLDTSENAVRTSDGQSVRVEVKADLYARLMGEVVGQMRLAACGTGSPGR